MTKMKESRKKKIVPFSSLRALDSLSTYLRINSLMHKVLSRRLAFSLGTLAFFKRPSCTESTAPRPQCVRSLPTHIKNVAFWDLSPGRVWDPVLEMGPGSCTFMASSAILCMPCEDSSLRILKSPLEAVIQYFNSF